MTHITRDRSLGPLWKKTRELSRAGALLRLKEALIKEEYEQCRNIIAVARELGASKAEVRYLLEDPRREPD